MANQTSAFLVLPNCFELFGFDFLVDEDLNVWILEVTREEKGEREIIKGREGEQEIIKDAR